MSKYITEFNQTGNSTIKVDLVCKDWNEKFFISTWINNNEEEYTFIINGKRKNTRVLKTIISKEQALEIISKLNLIHVKSSIFKNAGIYYTKEKIVSEINRITIMKHDKEKELKYITGELYQYEKCL